MLACAAILGYSAFFYHYSDFPAPWLALTLGGAAGVLAGRPALRTLVIRAVAVAIVLVAALQIRETFPLRQPSGEAMAHLIPKGACVVTDEASLTIAADRFADLPPGCPDIIDSLAATLVLSNGVSVQAGADQMPQVVAAWRPGWARPTTYGSPPPTGPGAASRGRPSSAPGSTRPSPSSAPTRQAPASSTSARPAADRVPPTDDFTITKSDFAVLVNLQSW